MGKGIILKSSSDLSKMKYAGEITAKILSSLVKSVTPGISTAELDLQAKALCISHNVFPAFKGYNGFPGSICISINDEVVHGLPSQSKILKQGDIVTLDFGVIADGWYSDSARTVGVGLIDPKAQQLLYDTHWSLELAIQQCYPGNHLNDIGKAIEAFIKPLGYGIVTDFGGHGIGQSLHEDPFIANYKKDDNGIELVEGMVLAIEPMINLGNHEIKLLDDNWTIATKDGSLSAHFEHTVAITSKGPLVLTIY